MTDDHIGYYCTPKECLIFIKFSVLGSDIHGPFGFIFGLLSMLWNIFFLKAFKYKNIGILNTDILFFITNSGFTEACVFITAGSQIATVSECYSARVVSTGTHPQKLRLLWALVSFPWISGSLRSVFFENDNRCIWIEKTWPSPVHTKRHTDTHPSTHPHTHICGYMSNPILKLGQCLVQGK